MQLAIGGQLTEVDSLRKHRPNCKQWPHSSQRNYHAAGISQKVK